MKKTALIIISALILFSLVSCTGRQSGETSTELLTETGSAAETEAAVQDHSNDPQYIQAVKKQYKKYKALQEEEGMTDAPLTVYMTDVNGDGYKDLFCCYSGLETPGFEIYRNGDFATCSIESEVIDGGMFPSGEESGYFIDSDNGIIVIRYDSHTVGTVLYRGAEAFQIEGTQAKSLWVEYYDEESHNGVEDYMLESEEYYEQVNSLVNKEFDEKQYLPRIKDYNLVNYYDVCVPWNEDAE